MYFNNTASAGRSSKFWIDFFIKAIFLTRMYVRTESQGDWPLHLASVKLMFHTSLPLHTQTTRDRASIIFSLFNETGELRIGKTKSVLKNQLKAEVSDRNST